MNKVILIGNLCKDIELNVTQSGKYVSSNSIAVRDEYKNADGEYSTTFINIVLWGNQAEYLKNYASKGDKVALCGRWQNRTYQDQNGNNRTVSECVVDSISNLSSKKQEQQTNKKLIPTDESLPF